MKFSILLSLTAHISIIIFLFYFTYIKADANYFISYTKNVNISLDILNDTNIKNKVLNRNIDASDKKCDKIETLKSSVDNNIKNNREDDFLNAEYANAIVEGNINGIELPLPYYPSYAKKRGISGTNVVDITIEEDGSISKVEIIVSSGYRTLDNAVKDTIEKMWHLPKPDKKLIVRKIFTFELD